MFINPTIKILDVWGEEVPRPGAKADAQGDAAVVTSGWAIVEALITPYPDEKPDESERLKRWALALKFVNAVMPVEIDPGEEIVMIKTAIAKRFAGPTLVARINEVIKDGERIAAEAAKPNGTGGNNRAAEREPAKH